PVPGPPAALPLAAELAPGLASAPLAPRPPSALPLAACASQASFARSSRASFARSPLSPPCNATALRCSAVIRLQGGAPEQASFSTVYIRCIFCATRATYETPRCHASHF